MLNKKHALTAAVLLSCSFFMAPYYAHAEEEEDAPDCGHGQHYMNINIDSPTPSSYTYTFDIYTASTHPGPHWRGEYQEDDEGNLILDANNEKIKVYASYRDFFPGEEQAFNKSIAYIHNMIQPSPTETVPVIKLELLPDQDANAAAQSDTYIIRDDTGKPSTQISDTELAAVLQGKYHPEDNDIVAEIEVDLAPPSSSWYIDKFPVLPSNGTNSDYYGTITHEMFHALGLGTYISEDTNRKVTFGTSANYGHNQSMAVFNKYEMGIRDVFGRVVYYAYNKNGNTYYDGGEGEQQPINPNASNITINGELTSRTIVPITLAQFDSEDFVIKPDEFYVLRGNDVGTASGAYFTGENVEEVLTTNDQLASIAWPDDSEAPAVQGLPLNGYEDSKGTIPELSHIELQNVNMSHQNYRNWCSFTEAELALMQDLGYNIDRSKYFGKSIYNSGTVYENETINYFTYDNTQGFNSAQMHGIGLHVYGSYVDVTQKADASINASGDYGIGIRVDGVGNKVTIATDISANGEGGNGLLVAYGKEHEITLNSGTNIEATDSDGVAARFDFGSNELSDYIEYRGSYILAKNSDAFEGTGNTWEIADEDLPDAINGELVTNFNVAGSLIGSKAAIYISPNAYVKNINILKSAVIDGDIISEWNPNEIIYQNGNIDELEDEEILKPALPYYEDGMTHLNFGYAADENGNMILDGQKQPVTDANYTKELSNNILGKDSLVIDLWAGELNTSGTNNVNIVHVADGASTQYTNTGDLTINSSLVVEGTFVNEGTLQAGFDSDGRSMDISGSHEGLAYLTGKDNPNAQFVLNAEEGLYKDTTTIYLINHITGDPTVEINADNLLVNSNSATLKMTAEVDEYTQNITITTARDYTPFAGTGAEGQLAIQLAEKASALAEIEEQDLSELDQKWANLLAGMDYNDSTGATAKQAMKALTPHVYGSSAQATLTTHTMMNNLNMLGSFSSNVPAARTSGGRGPAMDNTPKHNSWRNIVVPFSSYTDQHNGVSSYTNHNSGVLGAMERTLDNGLTHGYHAAVNHQSTSSYSQRIKGEGFYLGTHASYAPAKWEGWQVFGSTRLGLENMRSHRNLAIAGGSMGTSDADWTGFSGSFTLGTALEREHGVVKSGPFAALGYSFAHRPSVDEHGGIIPTHLDGATYDSLQTQLGYRLTTAPKALDSYDSTKWQAHASVAWNHELLNDNGSTDFALEGLSKAINDKTADYGRDSMSVAAGITFKTPKRLDVGLTLGSDIYRKGGSSVYGKVNFEWKF